MCVRPLLAPCRGGRGARAEDSTTGGLSRPSLMRQPPPTVAEPVAHAARVRGRSWGVCAVPRPAPSPPPPRGGAHLPARSQECHPRQAKYERRKDDPVAFQHVDSRLRTVHETAPGNQVQPEGDDGAVALRGWQGEGHVLAAIHTQPEPAPQPRTHRSTLESRWARRREAGRSWGTAWGRGRRQRGGRRDAGRTLWPAKRQRQIRTPNVWMARMKS